MLRVVLQTADELLYRFALIADLIDSGEEGEPVETVESQRRTQRVQGHGNPRSVR